MILKIIDLSFFFLHPSTDIIIIIIIIFAKYY